MPLSFGPQQRFRFFVFTCRDPKSDFRLPLVTALRHQFDTYYIWLRRRPLVSGPGPDAVPVEMLIVDLIRFIRRFRSNDAVNIYFNSTNTYFPGMSAALRVIAPPGVWCFDMHDDLRYHNTGWRRWREGMIVSALCRLSHVVVHAAPTLQELFPNSLHLGNASDIMPVTRTPEPPTTARDGRVLIIASFDERFDFDFLSELAGLCPAIQFHLHGWTRPDDAVTAEHVRTIVSRNENIVYHGGYNMAELPGILMSYGISVAPYRINTAITRYIDPLRYYHCLNAGLEVVSTAIPQAWHMQSCIHVVRDAPECARVLTDIMAGRLAKQPGYTPITWKQRAFQLVQILADLPRAARLHSGRKRPARDSRALP